MKEKKYVAEKIENFQAEIPVEEYMKECVDVATFLEFCKECSNYGTVSYTHLTLPTNSRV